MHDFDNLLFFFVSFYLNVCNNGNVVCINQKGLV